MANQNIILPRVLPFAVYILFLALSDYLSPLCNSLSIDTKWLYTLRAMSVLAVLVYFCRDYGELRIKPTVKELSFAGLAGLFVFFVWIMPYPSWATLGHHVQISGTNLGQEKFWLSTRLFGAVLIVPLMEEIFWRSFFMRSIDSRNFLNFSPNKISLFAFMVTASMFALAHHLWLAGLLAGLVYGALFIRYRNLWIPIAAHTVTNGVLGILVISTGSWQYW